MTAEKSIKILKAVKELKDDAIYTLTDLTEAYKMAIEALSKQESKQDAIRRQTVDKNRLMSYLNDLRLTYSPYPKGDEKLYEFINGLIKKIESWDDDDQFRDSAKKTDDVPDFHVGKNDFRPGDKFILELGAERRMFKEFEIAGTDLYVKTDLLEKLTKYEPEKFEIHNDHTDCIWYHYLDDDDDVPNACPSTCSQYRDGWNDAMKYIYCDGKGYQPYTRKAK